MAKHLFGFGLFISIVAFFGIAFWLPNVSRELPVDVEPPSEVRSWTYCDNKRRPEDVGSPRAVADRNSGTLTIYANQLQGDLDGSLTFYAIRGDEIRISDVISDSFVRVGTGEEGTERIIQYNAPWVRDLKDGDNVYVIAGSGVGKTSFPIDSAIGVLIKN